MSPRVSPTERIRAEIDELFCSDREFGDVLEDVARLGVRLLMQTALEAEVTEFSYGTACQGLHGSSRAPVLGRAGPSGPALD